MDEKIEYKILPPTTKEASEYEVASILMPLFFRTIVYAPSSSGKGVLLNNLLGDKFPYKKIFKTNIFVFSSTFSLGDSSLKDLDYIPEENIFSKLDENILKEILDEQKANIDEFGKKRVPPVLFIFDDVLSQISNKKNSVLREAFYSSRHYKCNIIMLVQSYKSVNKAMRTNSTHSIFFSFDNAKEREVIKEEMNASPKIFDKILTDATEDQPFSFLVVNHKASKDKRFQLRFTNSYYDINDYK